MITNCFKCGKEIKRKPSAVKEKNYCSRTCLGKEKGQRDWITKPCSVCGKPVSRCKAQMLETAYCSKECTSKFTSNRMANMNKELNKTRMTPEVKEKLRDSHLNTGEGKSYEKYYGRHLHRIVAEQMLGRPLLPGEVVHHIDEDKRNNHPSNLMVFPSQKEHAAHHAMLKKQQNERK